MSLDGALIVTMHNEASLYSHMVTMHDEVSLYSLMVTMHD